MYKYIHIYIYIYQLRFPEAAFTPEGFWQLQNLQTLSAPHLRYHGPSHKPKEHKRTRN